MKINAIKFRKAEIVSRINDREVKGAIILVSMFAAGMIFGAGVWRINNRNTQIAGNLLSELIAMRSDSSFFSIFINGIIFNSVFLLVIIMFGYSCYGSLFAFIVPMIRGVGYGIFSGYLYSEFLMNGIGYYLLTVFPSAVICNTLMILASDTACFSSLDILSVIIGKKQADASMLGKNLRTVVIYIAFLVLSSLLECVTIKAFAYLFKF